MRALFTVCFNLCELSEVLDSTNVEDLGIPQRVVTKPASNDEDKREKIINALEATQYNKTRAAEKLNMHRSTLHEN